MGRAIIQNLKNRINQVLSGSTIANRIRGKLNTYSQEIIEETQLEVNAWLNTQEWALTESQKERLYNHGEEAIEEIVQEFWVYFREQTVFPIMRQLIALRLPLLMLNEETWRNTIFNQVGFINSLNTLAKTIINNLINNELDNHRSIRAAIETARRETGTFSAPIKE